MTVQSGFPSAYDLKAPAGAEDWRDLYPYYLLFQDNRRAEYADVDLERDTGRTRAEALGAQGRAAMSTAGNIGSYTAGTTRDTASTEAEGMLTTT